MIKQCFEKPFYDVDKIVLKQRKDTNIDAVIKQAIIISLTEDSTIEIETIAGEKMYCSPDGLVKGIKNKA